MLSLGIRWDPRDSAETPTKAAPGELLTCHCGFGHQMVVIVSAPLVELGEVKRLKREVKAETPWPGRHGCVMLSKNKQTNKQTNAVHITCDPCYD